MILQLLFVLLSSGVYGLLARQYPPQFLQEYQQQNPSNLQRPATTTLVCKEEQFRLHRESGVCYQINSRGPCGENLLFVPQGPNHGTCKCSQKSHYYWTTYDRCFLIHSQGPCQFGYYLTVDHNSNTLCRLNPCGIPASINGTVHNAVRWTDGKCYLEGTKGPCGQDDQTFVFAGYNRPICAVGNASASFYIQRSAPLDYDLLQPENSVEEQTTGVPQYPPNTTANPAAMHPEEVSSPTLQVPNQPFKPQQGPNQQFPPQHGPNQQFPPQQGPNQQFPPQQVPNQQFPPQQVPNQQFPPQQGPNQQFPPQRLGTPTASAPVPCTPGIHPGCIPFGHGPRFGNHGFFDRNYYQGQFS